MSPWMELADTDAHEKETRLSDIVLLREMLPYLKKNWRLLVGAFVLLPLVSLTQVIQPFILKWAIDGPVAQRDMAGLLQLVALLLGAMAVHYGLKYLASYLAQVAGQKIVLTLRTALYDHLQRLSSRFYHSTPIGKLVTRVSSDVENISEMFAAGGLSLLTDLAVIVGVIVAMFQMNAELASVAICILPVVALTMNFFRQRSRGAYNELRVQQAQLNSTLQESLTGIDVIQLLRREEDNAARYETMNRTFVRTNLKSVLYDSSFTASVEFLSYITILMVIGYMVWQHGTPGDSAVTFGVLTGFLLYIHMLFEPIEEISDKFTIIQSGLASIEKIMDLMREPPDIVEAAAPVPLARARGRIRFENVRFGYNPARPVLKNLSLEIAPGEKIALIGATGAGKSTVIRLLNRQYDPQAGRILLDGVDIREYALSDLRRNIVVIPQDEFLFSRTVAENITLSAEAPDEKALATVAAQVHADQVVNRLPERYRTMLPERGRNLSNGERQLLVFARALWHDPAIIVLDEATSSIDPRTEELVQDALDRTLVGRTAIIIAHRLSTIEQVDRLYVIENGEVVESGPPAQLAGRLGGYSRYLGGGEAAEAPDTL